MMVELLHILIAVSTLALVLILYAINKSLQVIGIALRGIELHGDGLLGSAVRIHQALNRVT